MVSSSAPPTRTLPCSRTSASRTRSLEADALVVRSRLLTEEAGARGPGTLPDADLCHAFGCRQVRVFGGTIEGIENPIANAAETLAKAAEIARDAGILFAVETHDAWTNTEMLRSALREAGDPDGIGLLWDLQHPWYFSGEEPETSAKNLAGKVCNTHWKDLVRTPDGNYHLRLVGQGELPIARIWAALTSTGYDGWCTLEWEKRWHPDIEGPEIAIPAFADFIHSLWTNPQTL